MTDDRITELRSRGVLVQKDSNLFTIKIGSCGGAGNSSLLRRIADLADNFGDGSVRTTTRQVTEVYNIPRDSIEEALVFMEENGIPNSFSGTRLRTVVACPGHPVCRFSIGNTQELAREIKERFSSFSGLKTKIKVAVTGCPNACAKPSANCIGLTASGSDSWDISIGGKMGRQPKLARTRLEKKSREEVFSIIEKLLVWTRDNGQPKERLADLMDRLDGQLPV